MIFHVYNRNSNNIIEEKILEKKFITLDAILRLYRPCNQRKIAYKLFNTFFSIIKDWHIHNLVRRERLYLKKNHKQKARQIYFIFIFMSIYLKIMKNWERFLQYCAKIF